MGEELFLKAIELSKSSVLESGEKNARISSVGPFGATELRLRRF